MVNADLGPFASGANRRGLSEASSIGKGGRCNLKEACWPGDPALGGFSYREGDPQKSSGTDHHFGRFKRGSPRTMGGAIAQEP